MRISNKVYSLSVVLLFIATSFISNLANAQPLVDITLVDNGNNEIEVRVRPDGPFGGIFSASVFTIRWSASDNADLGFIQQPSPASSYHTITKSNVQFDTLGFRYQIFAGFSIQVMDALPFAWVANTEYTLMTIPVLNGNSGFEIVNDSYTNSANGDFFISLAGELRTGMSYSIPTSIIVGPSETYSVNILPNPNQGEFAMQFTTEQQDDYSLELLNSVGQVLYTKQLNKFSGVYNYQFDLSAESSGVYFLRVAGKSDNTVHRIVVE